MSFYLPQPPRVWGRVQTIPYCTDPDVPSTPQYTVYVPRTKQTVPPGEADFQDKILYKGNILQYKKNSSNLTKQQRYSQIAKGYWTNKTKSYATQSLTYTNPNTNALLRVNYTTTTSTATNPFDCSSNEIFEGGTMICNTLANPCTNELLKTYQVQNCFPITASDVPGFSNPLATKVLCWDPRINTWYPKTRRIMSSSGDKWPQNYKEFVSACHSK
jgi:hypothetical protein